MKTYTYFVVLFSLSIILLVSSCRKEPEITPPNQPTITSMKDLDVSDDFYYKTSKNVNINITLPHSIDCKSKTYSIDIYDNKTEKLLYKGSAINGKLTTNIIVSSTTKKLIVKSAIGSYLFSINDNNAIDFDFNSIYSSNSNTKTIKATIPQSYSLAKHSTPSTRSNLISNGDFSINDFSQGNETDAKVHLGKWFVGNANYFSIDNNVAHFYNRGYSISGELYQGFSITPGTDISVSIDIKANGYMGWSALRLAFYDDNGNSVAYTQVSIYPYSSWQTYTITATAPSTATRAVFYPIVNVSWYNAEIFFDNAVATSLSDSDSDGDGVSDSEDDFPNDDKLAYSIKYPTTGYGTYIFEDLWPYTGDYDFNDLVLNYQYTYILNAENQVVTLSCDFKVKAVGGSYKNGFGLELNTISNSIESITGNYNTKSYISYNSNGTEANQSKAVIIVFDNIFDVIQHPGGLGINTTPGNTYVDPVEFKVDINMKTPFDFATASINPFLIVNQDRNWEIHLAGYSPTNLVNTSMFGTGQDNSLISGYYKSKDNLPWGLDIPVDFDYAIEKADITQAYLKFAQWVESNGTQYQDWYLDKSGYRNSAKIYSH